MPHYAPILSGVYVAIFDLPRPRTIAIGRLGRFRFSAGRYLYVGSAQRNLQQRLARHARRRKPLRWHIDYLACHARFVGALIFEAPGDLECRLAAMLARSCARPVDGFGASDCRCGGHVFLTCQPSSCIAVGPRNRLHCLPRPMLYNPIADAGARSSAGRATDF